MKSIIVLSGVTAVVALMAGSAALQAKTLVKSSYAESIYADFADASTDRVKFQVKTIASGPSRKLVDPSLAHAVGEPRYKPFAMSPPTLAGAHQ